MKFKIPFEFYDNFKKITISPNFKLNWKNGFMKICTIFDK